MEHTSSSIWTIGALSGHLAMLCSDNAVPFFQLVNVCWSFQLVVCMACALIGYGTCSIGLFQLLFTSGDCADKEPS
jgi:hypothetical protein